MKKITLGVMTVLASLLIASCGGNSKKVTLTTPYEDAQICCELLNNCSSLNEIKEARVIIGKYISEYHKAVNKGDMTAPELNEFLRNCPNEAQIKNTEAFVAHFGQSINDAD